MAMRTFRTFVAGLLIGAALWLPVFVAASSAEGDAHGWSTLVALGLVGGAALLAAPRLAWFRNRDAEDLQPRLQRSALHAEFTRARNKGETASAQTNCGGAGAHC